MNRKEGHHQVTMLRFSLLFVTCLGFVSSYPSGPPTSVCTSMFPGHGVPAQTSVSPYSITVANTSYSAGDTIEVTLSTSGGDIRGYMLQARRADWSADQDEPIGSFQDLPSGGNAQFIECSNADDTFAHSSASTAVSSLTVTWVAPSPSDGHIRFRATVAEGKDTFWTDIYSETVDDPTAATIGPTPTPPSGVTGPSDLVTTSGCGTTKGCYADPVGCSDKDDCTTLITWREDGDDVIFQMLGRMASGNEYIAIGFSRDQSMGDDDVWACVNDDGGSVVLDHSNNVGRSNVRDTLDDSSALSGSYVDSVIQCQFTRKKASSTSRRKRASNVFFDLNDRYFLFIASGPKVPVATPYIGKHSSLPIISSSKIDFTSDDVVTGTAGSHPMLKAHASLMVFAWIGLTTTGIIIAKFFKEMWPNSTLGGQKVWFTLHRSIMVLNVLCFCTAFVLIFIHVGGFVTSDAYAHAICGILATCFGIANPIMAVFRPHPGTPKRPIFNWGHLAVGNIAYGLAVASVFIGMDLPALDLPQYTTWVLVAFLVFNAIIQILLGVSQYNSNKKSKTEHTPMKQYGTDGPPEEGKMEEEPTTKPDPPDALIRMSLLGGYIFVTVAVVLMLIIVIALH